jgi:hypothetical protein
MTDFKRLAGALKGISKVFLHLQRVKPEQSSGFLDFGVCKTQYIRYFVFSNLKRTYLFWDVVATYCTTGGLDMSQFYCVTFWVDVSLSYCWIARPENHLQRITTWNGNMLFFVLCNACKGKPPLITCIVHDWFPRTPRDKNPDCYEIFTRRIYVTASCYDVYFHTNVGISHGMLDKCLNRLCLEVKTFNFIRHTSLFLIIFNSRTRRQSDLRLLWYCSTLLYLPCTNVAWDVALCQPLFV